MKVPSSTSAKGPARTQQTASKAVASSTETAAPRTVTDAASVLGLSEAELSPNVRNALMSLLQEVDQLRRELDLSKRRIAHLERLADEDSMLPVANRRAFVRELSRMMAYAERYGTPGTILYFDVNNLKTINDTYGHAAGDEALQKIASVLAANVRSSDIVGRLGGDEFGVILAHSDTAAAQEKAAALLALVESDPLVWDGRQIPLSLAVGIHPFTRSEGPSDALHAADREMYRQKSERRA